MLGDCLKRRTLMNCPNNLRLMVHQTAKCLHSVSAASYSPLETPESGKSSTLWYSVDSSSHAGLSFAQLQRVDGDRSHGYYSHQDQYSVTMCVVLSFALARHLVQMPAAAHSIPRTSELSLHSMLLWDLGRSCPLWVWLWIQRDFVNPGIWAAFLCIHLAHFCTHVEYIHIICKKLH